MNVFDKIISFEDWGLIEYEKAWEQQDSLFRKLLQFRNEQNENDIQKNQRVIFCEHPHVYTLGKHGKPHNLLIDESFLKKIGASFFQIDRGGDITYHGPGQIVGYPVLDLQFLGLSLKQYIASIEGAIIRTLHDFHISAERMNGATGVWIDVDSPDARKICAIGVRASRYITMHGFALNVNTDLSFYKHINPCGFIDKGVTSMQQELKRAIDMKEVKIMFKQHFISIIEANHLRGCLNFCGKDFER